MKKKTVPQMAYFIMRLGQIGNIGPSTIYKIDEQPEEGFINENAAINHFDKSVRTGVLPHNSWANYTIIPIYSCKEV